MPDVDSIGRCGVEEVVEVTLLCPVGPVLVEQFLHDAVPPRAAPGVVEVRVTLHGVGRRGSTAVQEPDVRVFMCSCVHVGEGA